MRIYGLNLKSFRNKNPKFFINRWQSISADMVDQSQAKLINKSEIGKDILNELTII